MPEPHDQASPDRRASWVALRTLRQRPKVVDHTAAGEPIYEIQSVRLVLRDDASHFNRLVKCARCGRDVVGTHVPTAADLSHPSHPVICKDCSQFATRPAERATQPDSPPPPPPAPAPVPAARPAGTAVVVARDVVDGRRLAAVEAQLRGRIMELAEQLQVERTERAAISAALAEMRADMERMQLELSGRLPEPAAEDRLETRLDRVAHDVEDGQARIDALTASMDAMASLLHVREQRLTESVGKMTRLLESDGQPGSTGLLDSLEVQLQEADRRMARHSISDAAGE